MENDKFAASHRYFENRDCKYYPCHGGTKHINCLFCYCPLYNQPDCPGIYNMVERGGRLVKSCIDCEFPHEYDNYGEIIKRLK